MRRVPHNAGACFAAAAILLCAGCRSPAALRAPQDEGPIRAASREELALRIQEDAEAVGSLKGKLTLGFQESDRADLRTCRGVLAARSPQDGGGPGLYVKGHLSLVPTLFTLVSDGRRFWLHVPRDNVVYTGPVAQVRGAGGRGDVRLDARDLFRALFVQPLGAVADLQVEEEPSAYVVSTRREGRLERRLWVERRRFTVRREVFYDRAGREELAIDRERYVDAGGPLYPARMVLRDLVTGSRVLLDFEKLTVNPADLGQGAFRPRMPPDVRVETLAGLEEES